MNEKILKIPYSAVNNDWNLLQKFLELKGNPRYIIVGNVNLQDRKDIFDLGNLVGVEGDLLLGWSSIESLGELEFVDGNSSLWFCQKIKTLGKLKKVGGYLNLSWSSIESLGELEYVEGSFNLSNCKKIKTLGKLKKVEGGLNLEYSSIESLGDLEFVGGNLWLKNINIPPSEINKVEVVGEIIRY
jgi:glutamine cyclotransferase